MADLNVNKEKYKEELNQKLKDIAATDTEDELATAGDTIREIFYAMNEMDFSSEEMEQIFEGVDISDEKLDRIEAIENQERKR